MIDFFLTSCGYFKKAQAESLKRIEYGVAAEEKAAFTRAVCTVYGLHTSTLPTTTHSLQTTHLDPGAPRYTHHGYTYYKLDYSVVSQRKRFASKISVFREFCRRQSLLNLLIILLNKKN